ncbi:UNVERIFIED_CONTAM: hypothetical protein H355_009155 [Colinus virginianus]|nr:hypothetical protein H355_009155 [Colinus virginianus]
MAAQGGRVEGSVSPAGEGGIEHQELSESFIDFAIMFLQNGFQPAELGRKLEFKKVPHICHAVLQRMLTWVLSAVGKEKQEDASTLQAMRFWLNVFDVSIYKSAVHPDSLQQFFRHTLTEILTYNPLLKVSDAIHRQREWSFTRTCSLLTTLYRKLFVAFSAKESICQLQRVLETHEVNWQHVLSCVSVLVVCQAEAEQLFKDLLSHLLIKAFENYDMENMITAFLIARQAALEGPAVFMPYSEWFKASFGNASSHHGSSKKALVFLLEFLSELVPFEVAPYLKVHIMYPPFVPTKHRSILLEYITLAKTRLADLKVAIEDMGLYEDLSSTRESVQYLSLSVACVSQPQGQALRDVEKALQIFENTRKIPTSVIEARADKIPSNLYSTYVQACRAQKEKMLQDESRVEPGHSKEPTEQLKAELAALRVLIVDQAQHEDWYHPTNYEYVFFMFELETSDVPAQIAVISDRLSSVLGHSSDENEAASLNSQIHVNIFDPELEPCHLSGPALNDAHILGLAAFMVHLCESRSLIPEIEADFGISQPVAEKVLSISEFWSCLLVCRTKESLSFCARFCTAAVSYLMCKFASFSRDDLCALVPPSLVKKLQYIVPRLSLEARGVTSKEDKADLVWSSLACSSLNYRRASLCLWKQARFRELLKEKAFQLSFREWLLLELEMHPGKDVLSASERQDFHYWAVYQWYLPAPSASGGCDGDLGKACGIIINCILDFSQRLDLGSCGHLKSVSPDILCKLQEMVLELGCRRRPLPGCSDAKRHFLFEILQERLKDRNHGSALGEQLWRQQELLLHRRILVGLPASTLIVTCRKGKKTSLDCEDFFHYVNSELKNISSRGYALSYDITTHFFREGVDFQTSLEWSLEILQCLEERDVSWPLLFQSAEEGSGKYRVLHSAASDRHSLLMPVAFYSLTPGFHHKLLTREHSFLFVALSLYIQLLQLFVEGKDLPQPDQLLEACEKLDPEVGAALQHFSRPAVPMEVDEELFLL